MPTFRAWIFADEFLPAAFFRALDCLLCEGDVLAIGSYCPSASFTSQLLALGATQHDAEKIYRTSFDLNRREYPDGRSFELIVSGELLEKIAVEISGAEKRGDQFMLFDHVVAYRRGKPVVPLLDFHDAFIGGDLYLSSLFTKREVQPFAAALPSQFALVDHPAHK